MLLHNPAGPGTAKNSVHPVLMTDLYDEEIERLTVLVDDRSDPATRAGIRQ
jgi:hypothetical protein